MVPSYVIFSSYYWPLINVYVLILNCHIIFVFGNSEVKDDLTNECPSNFAPGIPWRTTSSLRSLFGLLQRLILVLHQCHEHHELLLLHFCGVEGRIVLPRRFFLLVCVFVQSLWRREFWPLFSYFEHLIPFRYCELLGGCGIHFQPRHLLWLNRIVV